jgi:ATP synthase protein I
MPDFPDSEDKPRTELPRSAENLMRRVGAREERMLRGKSQSAPSVWRAAGLVGMIGWTVAVPMLAGIAAGTWIDRNWPSRFSWTLMLLVGGLALGCVNAWTRIEHERRDH